MGSKHDITRLKGYRKDGRVRISDIYTPFLKLSDGWSSDVIDTHIIDYYGKKRSFPVYSFKTKNKGRAIWIIAGIHGEEPAGPIALARNVKFIDSLRKEGYSLVVIPLANPSGYFRNCRYLVCDKERSVGDSDSFLLGDDRKPRRKRAKSRQSTTFVKYILSTAKDYPPWFVLDLHEDDKMYSHLDGVYTGSLDDYDFTYVYSAGKCGSKDLIALEIVKLLKKHKNPMLLTGDAMTRFNERIVNGIVANSKDGSVDELITADYVFNKRIVRGPRAGSAIVVETAAYQPIKKRIRIHSDVIKSIPKFALLADRQSKSCT